MAGVDNREKKHRLVTQEAAMLKGGSAQYLNVMLDSSDDAIFAKTLDAGLITYWNRGAERLYGYSAAEAIGHPVSMLVPPELQDELTWIMAELRAARSLTRYETFRIAKNGDRRQVSLTISPIVNSDGNILGACTIARDVTDSRRALAALRYANALIESSEDAILSQDLNGIVQTWNRAASRLYGYAADEVIGRPIAFLIPQHRAGELSKSLESLRRGEALQPFETERLHKDGRLVDVSVTISPIRDHEGKLIGGSVIARDITARKRAERELVEAKADAEKALAQLATIVESIAEGVLVGAPDGSFLLTNRTFWECLGLERNAFQNGHDAEYRIEACELDGQPIAPGDWPFSLALRGQSVRQRELRVRRKGASEDRVLSHSAAPVFDSRGQVVLAVLTIEDVTERNRLHERIRQSEKLEAIGQLAGGIAHDMNNYLGCILLQVGLLAMKAESDAEMRQYCHEIQSVCDQARSVVRQLLAFGRRSVGMRVIVDVNKSCSSTLAMLQRLIGQPVSMEWDLEEPGWKVKTSPGHLTTILMNLSVNARDAMPNGGKLVIRTRNMLLDEPLDLKDVVIPPGEFVALSVRDTGTGIAPEHLDKIFEPFFTTKEVGSGTGLGLSAVYGAVREMNGYMHLETRLGEGTTFEVWLPRCTEADPASSLSTPSAQVRTTGRVMIVEDEPIVREAMAHFLRSRGFDVTSVASAQEALLVIRSAPGEFRTVLTDLVMPGMSGRNLAQVLLAEEPRMRIILMSGYDQEETVHDLRGKVEFLAKPFEVGELAAMLGVSGSVGTPGQ